MNRIVTFIYFYVTIDVRDLIEPIEIPVFLIG